MKTKEYLKILAEEIHSVVVATIDDNGLPTTRVIDMMLYDDRGIYFLTAKGKAFYTQLMNKGYLSLSGMIGGKETMSRKAISVSGAVRNIGSEKLEDIFKRNVYMADIYQTEESRSALEVFHIYKGRGEYFDLSTKPITRGIIVFGGTELQNSGFSITESCTKCGLCLRKCPQNCITVGIPYKIQQANCLHCGNCYEVCPVGAVSKRV